MHAVASHTAIKQYVKKSSYCVHTMQTINSGQLKELYKVRDETSTFMLSCFASSFIPTKTLEKRVGGVGG